MAKKKNKIVIEEVAEQPVEVVNNEEKNETVATANDENVFEEKDNKLENVTSIAVNKSEKKAVVTEKFNNVNPYDAITFKSIKPKASTPKKRPLKFDGYVWNGAMVD